MILPAQACNNSCDGHTRYDPTASSTAVDLGRTFEIKYSGGSDVNGTLYADNVFMGGYEVLPGRFPRSHLTPCLGGESDAGRCHDVLLGDAERQFPP